jgi:hypothetical protein
VTKELADKRTALAPEIRKAWNNFSKTGFKEGALPKKQNKLIC